MKDTQTYPLRLPRSLKEAVERLSREDRTSINQFVAMAVAEKVSALQTATYFVDRRARANFQAFDKIMKRKGSKKPIKEMKYRYSIVRGVQMQRREFQCDAPKRRRGSPDAAPPPAFELYFMQSV
jgi:hypothetical protein